MLVITRKAKEKFVIDWGEGAAIVTVTEIKKGSCRLGIQASEKVGIYREEVKKEIRPGSVPSSISFNDIESEDRVRAEPLEFVSSD